MSIYRRNALCQLKDTMEILILDNEDMSVDEVFQRAKKYEIEMWKDHMNIYKGNNQEKPITNYANVIKICKNMIKELSKITINDLIDFKNY